MTLRKEDILQMASGELELLFTIIGDLGYLGYKISLCKLHGNSYQQCANKFKISKSAAQYHFEKCIEKQYDITLKQIFHIQ